MPKDSPQEITQLLVAWSDGDEKQHPRFIETVPRRGYRFIAKVTEASKNNISENGAGRAVALPAAEQRDTPPPWFKKFGLPVAAAVIIGALSLGFWYAPSKNRQPTAPILFASFSSEKLSTNVTLNTFSLTDRTAELRHVAWLPDAKNLVYISVDREGGKTLWLQPLDGHTPRKLAALGDEGISDFAFSPDGKKFAVAQGSWRHDAVLMRGLR